MAELSEAHWDKVTKGRLALSKNNPFFYRLAMYLHPVATKGLGTVGVESTGRLHVDPEFIEKLSDHDVLWLMCHEVMHLVCIHMARMPLGAHPMLWNIACDVVINKIIRDTGLKGPNPKVMQPVGLTEEWDKYEGHFTESVYYELFKEMKKTGKGGEGDEGEEGDQEGKGFGGSTGTEKDGPFQGQWWDDSGVRSGKRDRCSDKQAQKWKQRAANSAQNAKNCSQLPGNLDEFMTTLLHPKHPWEEELRMVYAHTMKTGKWTWRRPGRRTAGRVRTPARDPKMPVAACYLDTSGSMSDDEIRRCLSEIAKITQLCGGEIRLLLGDAEIYYDGKCDVKSLTCLPMQRGGTDFRVVFDAIATWDEVPQIFIGFSDLCGPFPDNRPDFPVVWCKPKHSSWSGSAPWGDKEIEVDIS